MPDVRVDTEGSQQSHTADTEQPFLTEAHLTTLDVQQMRDTPVAGTVLRDVRVQQ